MTLFYRCLGNIALEYYPKNIMRDVTRDADKACNRGLQCSGKRVLGVQLKVEKAAESQWRLKAIDQLEMSEDFPEEERAKLIVELVGDDNQEITDELLKNAAAKNDQPRRRRRKSQQS